MGSNIRVPAVAGQFYDSGPDRLEEQISRFIDRGLPKRECIGVLCPHAGLMYSGAVAGMVYSSAKIPPAVILIGPNHTGRGARASIMSEGEWTIPFGSLRVNSELAGSLAGASRLVEEDSSAHIFEHSLEVQLPFIYTFRPDAGIVPLTLMHLGIDECRQLGDDIAGAIKAYNGEVLIVASSDMSHYVPDKVARVLDGHAIDKLLDIDPEGLYDVIKKERISMCGFVPATVMLFAAKGLGATRAELIRYATSGEVSGDYDHVVGYAGILVE